MGPVSLVLDLRISHERLGSSSARRFINNDAVWVCVYVGMCKALEFSKQHLVIQLHRQQATNEQTRI